MPEVTIKGVRLVQTCGACPEQYDAFIGEEMVGYLRLRHGAFTVQYPDVSGTYVYTASPRGDGLFEMDERERYLRKAAKALKRAHRSKQFEALHCDD